MSLAAVIEYSIIVLILGSFVLISFIISEQVSTTSSIRSSQNGLENILDSNFEYSITDFEPNDYNADLTLFPFKDLNLHSSKCQPVSMGFTDLQAEKLIRYKKYQDCSSNDQKEIRKINSSLIDVSCKKNDFNFYFLSPEEKNYNSLIKSEIGWVRITEEKYIKVDNSQFVFIRCGHRNIYGLVFNHFDSKISNDAQNKRKAMEKKFNVGTTRPMAIQLLVFDSLSRLDFYRTHPKTIEFLKDQVLKGKFSEISTVFDFSMASHLNLSSDVSSFGVFNENNQLILENEMDTSNRNQSNHFNQTKSYNNIWDHLGNLGYVTMYGDSYVNNLLDSNLTMNKISSNLNNFWKATKILLSNNNSEENGQCIGAHSPSWYLMDYSLQFINNYQGHHRLGYTHINSYQNSIKVIGDTDKDLVEYLDNFLQYFLNHNDEDFFLILLSDKGKSHAGLEFFIENFIENHIGFAFILTNKNFLNRTGSSKVFEINTNTIISKFDLHLTLKTVSISPFGKLDDLSYNYLKKTYPFKTVSLFMEKIDENRDCIDLFQDKNECICKDFESIYEKNEEIDIITTNIIEEMVFATINNYTNTIYNCSVLDFYKLTKASVFVIKDWDIVTIRKYKIEISAPSMIFQVMVNMADHSTFNNNHNEFNDNGFFSIIKEFEFRENKYKAQIVDIKIIAAECAENDVCECDTNLLAFYKLQKITCNEFCKSINGECGISKYLYIDCADIHQKVCLCN